MTTPIVPDPYSLAPVFGEWIAKAQTAVSNFIGNAKTGTLTPAQRDQAKYDLKRDMEKAGGNGYQVEAAQSELDRFIDKFFPPRSITPEAVGVSAALVLGVLSAGALVLWLGKKYLEAR